MLDIAKLTYQNFKGSIFLLFSLTAVSRFFIFDSLTRTNAYRYTNECPSPST